MGELIAVLSGKGGTGKTSVCAGIATALAAAGKQVLCIDCDVGLRNLDISLGLSDCGALSFLEAEPRKTLMLQAMPHLTVDNLYFFTAPMNRPASSIDPLAFGELMLKARKEFDYIFLDAPAGVEAGFRLTAAYADRCILVTGPGPAAIRDAARVSDILELMGKTNIRLIVNRVSRKMANVTDVTVDDVMDTAGLPLLGVIPEDLNVTLAAAFGKPLLLYRKRCAAARACRRIARRIQGFPEPIVLR